MRLILILLLSVTITGITLSGCDKEAEPTARISINETGSDLGGDVTGNGGSTSETYNWTNPEPTADWNMDITAASGGTLQLQIRDADGNTVLNQSLSNSSADDTKSGVTSSGTTGTWRITVSVTNFEGDGSFSISPGD
jgi:hypothetical protein